MLETSFWMTDTASDGPISVYFKLIQHYHTLFPDCWPIFAEAHEITRLQFMPQFKRELSVQDGYVEWPAKTLLDNMILGATKNADFWREHYE